MKLNFDDSDEENDNNNGSFENSRYEINDISSSSVQDLYKQTNCKEFQPLNGALPTIAENSPPCKKIRALRLFDSPVTPKTLLQKCAADSTSNQVDSHVDQSPFILSKAPPSLSGPCTRSRIRHSTAELKDGSKSTPSQQNSKCQHDHDCSHLANVNPFTPQGIRMSIRKTTRRDFDGNISHTR